MDETDDLMFRTGIGIGKRLAEIREELEYIYEHRDEPRLVETCLMMLGALEEDGSWQRLAEVVEFYDGWEDKERAKAEAHAERMRDWDRRRRRMDELALSLQCGYCHAEPGVPCMTSSGKPFADVPGSVLRVHAARQRAGGKAYDAEQRAIYGEEEE